MKPIILLAIAASFVAGTASAQGKPMTQDQLERLTGKGVKLQLGGPSEGYSGELILTSDGRGRGTVVTDSGNTLTLTGTYEIRDGLFCRKWMEFDDGAEACETWLLTTGNSSTVLLNGEKIGVNSW